MNKPKRVYVLEYNINFFNNTNEHRILYYTFEDRQNFINEYLKVLDNYMIDSESIRAYYAELEDLDMNTITNAI